MRQQRVRLWKCRCIPVCSTASQLAPKQSSCPNASQLAPKQSSLQENAAGLIGAYVEVID